MKFLVSMFMVFAAMVMALEITSLITVTLPAGSIQFGTWTTKVVNGATITSFVPPATIESARSSLETLTLSNIVQTMSKMVIPSSSLPTSIHGQTSSSSVASSTSLCTASFCSPQSPTNNALADDTDSDSKAGFAVMIAACVVGGLGVCWGLFRTRIYRILHHHWPNIPLFAPTYYPPYPPTYPPTIRHLDNVELDDAGRWRDRNGAHIMAGPTSTTYPASDRSMAVSEIEEHPEAATNYPEPATPDVPAHPEREPPSPPAAKAATPRRNRDVHVQDLNLARSPWNDDRVRSLPSNSELSLTFLDPRPAPSVPTHGRHVSWDSSRPTEDLNSDTQATTPPASAQRRERERAITLAKLDGTLVSSPQWPPWS